MSVDSAITHRRIWRLAAPIILSNATIPLLGAMDTAVVGQLGEAAPIGAVGLGAVILTTLYWVFGFLRMGTSGLAAQAHGAGDEAECTAILLRGLIAAGLAGLALTAAQQFLILGALRFSPASPEVEELARQYLVIRLWGAPATISIYAITGWLVALERTGRVLAMQLLINLINVVLDLWFVLGLGWGVRGVAFATLAAEWSGALFGLWLCREAFGPALAAAARRLWDRMAVRTMLAVNGDIMVRSVLLQLSFTSFIFLAAGEGDLTLAANQILIQLLRVTDALDGIEFAAESLVGQAVGQRRPLEVRRASRLTLCWLFAGAALLSLVYMAAGGAVIDLMATDAAVRAEARQFLPWLIVAPLIGAAGWGYDGIYIGATLTRLMRQIMILCVAIYAIAVVILLPAFGNHGLWAALMCLYVSRGVLMWRSYPAVEARAA